MRWLPALLAVAACQAPPSGTAGPEPAPASKSLGLVRSVSWPGGGRELTVRVQTEAGLPITGDVSSGFSLLDDAGASLVTRVTIDPLSPGFTAILVVPATDPGARAALVAELEQLVDSRPSGERIAVYAWLRSVEQVGNFTADRQRLRRLIARFADIQPDSTPAQPSVALREVEIEAASVGGKAPRVMRSVVVAGSEALTPAPSAIPVIIGTGDASARIDEFAATSHYRVAVCGPTAELTTTLRVAGLEGSLSIDLPAALPEEASASCDPALIGPGNRVYPSRIELVFDSAQRAVYDQRVADLSKASFDVSVALGAAGVPISASAHLRGRGTLLCERKSYTVALDGPGRHLLPGARTDEFYLLSMCADDRYVNQFTANLLLGELGLFPLAFGFVELRIDGESEGVYLLLEKTREELVRDNARVQSVLRRRFNPPNDVFEVKYTETTDAAAVAAYEAVNAANVDDNIDLDQYLRFLALMTAYQNGDYIDEIWVTATDHMTAQGAAGSWFEMMAWDNDDLFSSCHYTGKYAFVDPNQLVYCAEARLDHAILADASIYDRYVDSLAAVLSEVTEARFAAAVETTASAILPFFEDPAICAAMVLLIADNPAAVDPAIAQQEIRAKLDGLNSLFTARRAQLLGDIESYRGIQ